MNKKTSTTKDTSSLVRMVFNGEAGLAHPHGYSEPSKKRVV